MREIAILDTNLVTVAELNALEQIGYEATVKNTVIYATKQDPHADALQ